MTHEEAEQVYFFDWIDKIGTKKDPRLAAVFHPANGGKRNLIEAVKFKRMGVRAGVLDIVVPIPVQPYHGLFVELKIKPNKLTDKQNEYAGLVRGLGYMVSIAWSGQEAVNILNDYLRGPAW